MTAPDDFPALRYDDALRELLLVPRPERLETFLAEYAWEMEDADYWRIVADLWSDTEFPSSQYDAWHHVWTVEHMQPFRTHAMTEDERRELEALPTTVTVYRGFNGEDWRGLSWTLDRPRAEWFARRFAFRSGTPRLAVATIAKPRILALLNTRNEREVVAVPDDLDVRIEELEDSANSM